MSRKKNDLRQESDSPESKIQPYEDLSTRQARISGEKFPCITLGICDNCHWCYTSINSRGIVKICPICNSEISQVPMTLEEVCRLEIDEKGMIMDFTRKLPAR